MYHTKICTAVVATEKCAHLIVAAYIFVKCLVFLLPRTFPICVLICFSLSRLSLYFACSLFVSIIFYRAPGPSFAPSLHNPTPMDLECDEQSSDIHYSFDTRFPVPRIFSTPRIKMTNFPVIFSLTRSLSLFLSRSLCIPTFYHHILCKYQSSVS